MIKKRKAKKAAAKRTTKRRRTYNPQTGRLTGRAVAAQERISHLGAGTLTRSSGFHSVLHVLLRQRLKAPRKGLATRMTRR